MIRSPQESPDASPRFWHLKTVILDEGGERLDLRPQSFAIHTLDDAFRAFQQLAQHVRSGRGS